MIDYINTSFTMREMAELNQTIDILDEWQNTVDFLNRRAKTMISNGRISHAMVSEIISQVSDYDFVVGGQGWKEPDLLYQESKHRTEQKAFIKGENKAWVAKSTFFASNPGTKPLKEWLQKRVRTEKEKKEYMVEKSYSDDDYYFLTSTAEWDGDIGSTQCIFVETELLKKYLIEEHSKGKIYCYVDLESLLKETENLVEKNKINLAA